MSDVLYIVVPCYNEEEVLPETSRRLKEKMEALVAAGTVRLPGQDVGDHLRPSCRRPCLFRGGPDPEPGPSERPLGRIDDGQRPM